MSSIWLPVFTYSEFVGRIESAIESHLAAHGARKITFSNKHGFRTITITCEWPIEGPFETFADIHHAERVVRESVALAEADVDCLLASDYNHTYQPSRLVLEIVDDHGQVARPATVSDNLVEPITRPTVSDNLVDDPRLADVLAAPK